MLKLKLTLKKMIKMKKDVKRFTLLLIVRICIYELLFDCVFWACDAMRQRKFPRCAALNPLDMGGICWCSFAVWGCMGQEIEVQETVNKIFNFCKAIFEPCQSGAHGTCHGCHTLDMPLPIGLFKKWTLSSASEIFTSICWKQVKNSCLASAKVADQLISHCACA